MLLLDSLQLLEEQKIEIAYLQEQQQQKKEFDSDFSYIQEHTMQVAAHTSAAMPVDVVSRDEHRAVLQVNRRQEEIFHLRNAPPTRRPPCQTQHTKSHGPDKGYAEPRFHQHHSSNTLVGIPLTPRNPSTRTPEHIIGIATEGHTPTPAPTLHAKQVFMPEVFIHPEMHCPQQADASSPKQHLGFSGSFTQVCSLFFV